MGVSGEKKKFQKDVCRDEAPVSVGAEYFKKVGNKTALVGIIGNAVLAVLKLVAGLVAHSGAMISDAVHTASDVLATGLVMVGINMSTKEEDEKHPYGHERMECVVAIILAGILFVVGLGIGKVGISRISLALAGDLSAPGMLALVAAVVSIVIKEWMFWYTRANAKKINSTSLMADAWHHRSDALSSVGSFVGIFGARLGLPILDPIVSLLICLLIIKVAYDIAADALGKVVDSAWEGEKSCAVREQALSVEGVICVDDLKTRKFGSKVYVDMEIAVDKDLSLLAAHEIAEAVHLLVEKSNPEVKHCMIHVNPYMTEDGGKEQKASVEDEDL